LQTIPRRGRSTCRSVAQKKGAKGTLKKGRGRGAGSRRRSGMEGPLAAVKIAAKRQNKRRGDKGLKGCTRRTLCQLRCFSKGEKRA